LLYCALPLHIYAQQCPCISLPRDAFATLRGTLPLLGWSLRCLAMPLLFFTWRCHFVAFAYRFYAKRGDALALPLLGSAWRGFAVAI